MADYKSRTERRQQQSQKGKHSSKPPKRKKGIFKKIVLSLILIFLLLGLAGIVTVVAIAKGAPPLDPSKLRDPLTTKILDMNNKTATNIFTSQRRIYAPINKIPKVVQNAFVSTEDVRFYHHFGIDLQGIARAAFIDILTGHKAEGGSTITQQVIKNSYLTPGKTFTRKIREAYLAIKLEQKYSKSQILEMYLNKIYLGEGTYGVATAAEIYFGKPINKVNLSEAAVLASLPKAPSYYDPYVHPNAEQARRNLVLDTMVKNGYISQSQANKAKAIPIKKMLKKGKIKTTQKYNAFVQEVHHELVDEKKIITDDEFYKGGLTIYTTLNPKAQKFTDRTLKSGTFQFQGHTYTINNNLDAATALIDTHTGAIRAIGAGRKYKNYGDFDHAIANENQVGSTAKPIFDYGPAIDYMHWSTAHQLVDQPHSYSNGTKLRNWDNTYYGPMTMRAALALSRNIPAVETYQTLLSQEGPDKIESFINKLGFTNQKLFSPTQLKTNESYAIGSFVSSPLQMTGAYAAFGNQGVYNQPYTVRKIVFPDGNVVKVDHAEHPAMQPSTAYMITDMLKSVFNMVWQTPSAGTHTGTGILVASDLKGIPVAAKTGTQNQGQGVSDEWMVGYTTQYSLGVWTGYDNNANMTATDQYYARALFANMMSHVSSNNVPDFKMPDSVVRKTVEKYSGLLPSSGTPSSMLTSELFVKGYEPTQVSNAYQKLASPTNLKTQYDPTNHDVILSWDYPQTNGVAFEIAQKVRNKYQPLGSTPGNQIKINNVIPGSSYEFSVTAAYTDKSKASQTSDPATIQVDIPQDNSNGPGNGTGQTPGDNSNQPPGKPTPPGKQAPPGNPTPPGKPGDNPNPGSTGNDQGGTGSTGNTDTNGGSTGNGSTTGTGTNGNNTNTPASGNNTNTTQNTVHIPLRLLPKNSPSSGNQ